VVGGVLVGIEWLGDGRARFGLGLWYNGGYRWLCSILNGFWWFPAALLWWWW
ncbi:hypothetical protein A2U01_0058613, partial [Trifolium medium]|nr:hypothetical protein [Trifolium medium]